MTMSMLLRTGDRRLSMSLQDEQDTGTGVRPGAILNNTLINTLPGRDVLLVHFIAERNRLLHEHRHLSDVNPRRTLKA